MGLYYTIDSYELKDIDDELFQKWIETNNPKSSYYIKALEKPNEDSVWNNGVWTTPLVSVPESVTARQIRLWLIQNGVSLQSVNDAINNIPDQTTRDKVDIEWEYAPYIERGHPMLVPLAQSLGLTEGDIDRAFTEASNI